MKAREIRRWSVGICAVILFGGCGGTQPPAGAPNAMQVARSWIASQTIPQKLLYVSDLGTNAVDVYPYPKGALIGKLTGFGSVAGLCTDTAGDVFVVDESGPVVMFAHGGTTPIRTLATTEAPYGCAVDPASGDLALTNLSSYLAGVVSIYRRAKGSPKVYKDTSVDSTYFCSYDGKGNLFVDGWDRSANFILIELPKGASTFTITHLQGAKQPGGVQFDGHYVAVGDQGAGVVYRMKGGAVAQTIKLGRGANVEQFWIAGSTIVGPNAQNDGTVGFWSYPSGGAPTQSLNAFVYPIAAAVSIAP